MDVRDMTKISNRTGERMMNREETIPSITKSVYECFSDHYIRENNITRQEIAKLVSERTSTKNIFSQDEQVEIHNQIKEKIRTIHILKNSR